jgi:hypothetical protein
MAENSKSRTAYVAGILVLAALVVAGVLWRRSAGDRGEADGAAAADAGESDSGDGDGGGDATASASGDGGTSAAAPPPSDGGPALPPDDPAGCRAYCQGLADRGELSRGVTAERCVAQLCTEAGDEGGDEGAAEADPVPTVGEPAVGELPDDCAAQCRALHGRGELRAGMTVEQCIEAMCTEDEEVEE